MGPVVVSLDTTLARFGQRTDLFNQYNSLFEVVGNCLSVRLSFALEPTRRIDWCGRDFAGKIFLGTGRHPLWYAVPHLGIADARLDRQ